MKEAMHFNLALIPYSIQFLAAWVFTSWLLCSRWEWRHLTSPLALQAAICLRYTTYSVLVLQCYVFAYRCCVFFCSVLTIILTVYLCCAIFQQVYDMELLNFAWYSTPKSEDEALALKHVEWDKRAILEMY